ncbi:MAG: sulfatase-like hydrolase/transferase [Flavobacteriales bacterium]|nr:sulfatase-like hydrolase/transferase [Flavobacteriales bacterium]
MIALLRYLLVLLLCWMLVFLLQQACFIFFEPAWTDPLSRSAILFSFQRALPMDLAAACYFTLPIALLCLPLLWKEIAWLRRVNRILIGVFLVISAIISVSDLALFRAWGTKINHKALSYLIYPDEAFAAAGGAHPGQLVVILLAQVAVGWFLFSRMDHRRTFRASPLWGRIAALVLFPSAIFIGMRGGVQDYPIDRSWSYHSVHPVLNLGALNGVWNVIVLFAEPPEIASNPYTYMPKEEADRRFAELHASSNGEHHIILSTERPNVIMVLLESWAADVVGVLGGDAGVTPGFDRLAKNGLLFTNFYSTGFRTEQGLCAMMSGFPSQPKTTIIRQYGKFDRLPSMVNVLDSVGYHSTYFYAGDVAFANTRAYLETIGFNRIHDENSFPIVKRTEWGAYDEELFAFHTRTTRNEAEPFFHAVMTSSSHEPFDIPVDEGFEGRSDAQLYRNSIHYSDRTLAAFMDSCKHQPWYDRTLIIIVADHGHYLPHNRGNHTAERHRIPFLITGGALIPQLRGKQDRTFGCHVDVAATLLGQLGLPSDRFEWSKDLFDSGSKHFAFWTFDDGFGIADSKQSLVFDNLGKRVLQLRDTTTAAVENARLIRDGQALEQVLLDRYITLSQ